MRKSEVMAQFAVRSPSQIDFPAPERSRKRIQLVVHRVIPALVTVLIVGGVASALYIILVGLDWTITPLVIGLAFVGLGGLLPAAYWLDQAPIDVREGILTFPYRTKRRDGRKTDRLPLEEVVQAKAVVELYDVPNPNIPVTRAAMGLTVTLADGTIEFLPQSRFGAHGLEILQKIGNLHGISYLDQTMESLRGPRYPRFHVWGVRGFKDDAILLSKKMRTYSSGQTKVIRPDDVLFVEPLATDFAGPGYVFIRTDGIFAFLQGEKLDRYRVWSSPAWADKLAE